MTREQKRERRLWLRRTRHLRRSLSRIKVARWQHYLLVEHRR